MLPRPAITRLRLVRPGDEPEPLELPAAGRPLWQDLAMTLVLCIVIGTALWLLWSPKARASEPLPDIAPTLAQLDRMPAAIWEHELTVARYAPWARSAVEGR